MYRAQSDYCLLTGLNVPTPAACRKQKAHISPTLALVMAQVVSNELIASYKQPGSAGQSGPNCINTGMTISQPRETSQHLLQSMEALIKNRLWGHLCQNDLPQFRNRRIAVIFFCQVVKTFFSQFFSLHLTQKKKTYSYCIPYIFNYVMLVFKVLLRCHYINSKVASSLTYLFYRRPLS